MKDIAYGVYIRNVRLFVYRVDLPSVWDEFQTNIFRLQLPRERFTANSEEDSIENILMHFSVLK